jgi:flagellar basal body-associated protein FliL
MTKKEEKKEEKKNLNILLFGFLGMIAVGLGVMFMTGFIQTGAYEKNLSNSVESFKQLSEGE